jgi:3-oxoacyl-[acyl-carrier protein] reductase
MSLAPDIAGRIALVTGGSRGIGSAIAVALARCGARVAVNFRERAKDAQAVVDTIGKAGGRAVAVQADVSNSRAVVSMFETISAGIGPVDILVNNAGVGRRRGLDDLTEAEFDEAIAVNLKSAFLCSQAALPHMRAQKWGRIVNISSGAARGAGGMGVHYNASKAGMEGLTRGYAARLVTEGITVNAIAPSMIETDMVREQLGDRIARVPMGRLGLPEECAQAVLMVVGNAYMTGQTIQLNGGASFI